MSGRRAEDLRDQELRNQRWEWRGVDWAAPGRGPDPRQASWASTTLIPGVYFSVGPSRFGGALRAGTCPWLYACSRSWCPSMEPAPGSRDWEAGQRKGYGCGGCSRPQPCRCCSFRNPGKAWLRQSEQGLVWPQPQALGPCWWRRL